MKHEQRLNDHDETLYGGHNSVGVSHVVKQITDKQDRNFKLLCGLALPIVGLAIKAILETLITLRQHP